MILGAKLARDPNDGPPLQNQRRNEGLPAPRSPIAVSSAEFLRVRRLPNPIVSNVADGRGQGSRSGDAVPESRSLISDGGATG